MNHGTTASQIQQANIYDLQRNSLLIDELVLMDKKYEFNRYAQSVHTLIGKSMSQTDNFLTLFYRKVLKATAEIVDLWDFLALKVPWDQREFLALKVTADIVDRKVKKDRKESKEQTKR